MEQKQVGLFDNALKTMFGSKRKVASQNLEHLFRASSEKLSIQSNCDSKLGKRKTMVDCESNCYLYLRKSVLKNYLNFTRSRLPQRVLFYQNSEWIDFPEDVILIVKEDFRAKRTMIEVKVCDCHIMFDILHMVQVDLINGSQKPIAWIDEAGNSFFPESYHICCEMHCNLTEDLEESNIGFKRIKVNPLRHNQEFAYDKQSDEKMEQVAENKLNQETMSPDLVASLKLVDQESVKNMFIMGMNVIPNMDEIKITKYSSNYLRSRLEIFEKQVEITQIYRGNANVRYAWLAASKDLISTIMNYGLAPNRPKNRPNFGIGVHLSAQYCAFKSAINCEADKNGIHYMVFTRVILGNVEPLHCGSGQWHPSHEKYDSGVDDLDNPTHYVIWNMNINTHIYPECVVSFRIPPGAEGPHFRNDSRIDVSGVSTCRWGSVDQISTNAFAKNSESLATNIVHLGCHCHQISIGKLALEKAARTPKSPWLPFSLLINAISNEITSRQMNLVTSNFVLFKSKKICRDEFVRRLRLIVGDTLLKSTITSFLCKVPSKCIELVQPEQEPLNEIMPIPLARATY